MATRERWRDLVGPEIQAAYDAGKKLPRDEGWLHEEGKPVSVVSRNKRLVTFNPALQQHQPDSGGSDGTYRRARLVDRDVRAGDDTKKNRQQQKRVPLNSNRNGDDAELKAYYRDCVEAIDGFALQPASCISCGCFMRGDFAEKRVTIIEHTGGDENHAVVFCMPCFTRLGIPIRRPDPMQGLSELDRKVWGLYKKGMIQKQIGFSLSTPYRNLTQPKVSRIISKVRRHHLALYVRANAA